MLESLVLDDQRAAPRFMARVSVGLQMAGRVIMTQSRDFSRTGVFLECTEPVEVGAEVALFILPAGASQSLKLDGHVVRVVPTGMGIHLSQLGPELRRKFEVFLANLAPPPLEPVPCELPDEFNPKAIEAAIDREKGLQAQRSADAQILFTAARAALDTGDVANGIVKLEQAVALSPNIASFHQELGAALYSIGQVERAVKEFDKALQLEPEHE